VCVRPSSSHDRSQHPSRLTLFVHIAPSISLLCGWLLATNTIYTTTGTLCNDCESSRQRKTVGIQRVVALVLGANGQRSGSGRKASDSFAIHTCADYGGARHARRSLGTTHPATRTTREDCRTPNQAHGGIVPCSEIEACIVMVLVYIYSIISRQ
jgi:hypothetical protein